MLDFTYYVPTKIIFSIDGHKNVGQIISEYNIKNVLIHYGQKSVIETGLLDEVIKSLEDYNINYHLLGGVVPNPTLSMVKKGVEVCKKHNIELILAVGGGSVIDSSKLISHGSVVDFDPWLFQIKEKEVKDSLKIGVILTLSAAGSEMSSSCVITNDETNEKRGFNSPFNRPLFSILNPKLTLTVSKYQTACGIVDILMHTLERYFAEETNSDITDEISLGLVKSVIKNGTISYNLK